MKDKELTRPVPPCVKRQITVYDFETGLIDTSSKCHLLITIEISLIPPKFLLTERGNGC
jgi:hypothetical protein